MPRYFLTVAHVTFLLGWLCLLLVGFLGLVFLASPVSLGLCLHSRSFMYYSLRLYYSSGNTALRIQHCLAS